MSGQPQTSVTLRRDLMDLMDEISFEELGLAGEKILPTLKVRQPSGSYPILPREAKMKVPDTSRGPHGTFARGQWDWSSQSYITTEYGYEETVDNTQTLENEEWIDEEEISAELTVNGLLLARESRVAGSLFNETAFAGTSITNPSTDVFKAGTTNCLVELKTAMDSSATAKVFDVFDLIWSEILRKKCGLAKNQFSLICSDDLVKYMLRTKEVQDSVIYVEPVARMTAERKREFLTDYLGIKEIVTVSSIYDTSGLSQSAEIGKFWSNKYALLAKLSSGKPSFKEGCLGRQPSWSKYANNYIIEDYPDPTRNGIVYRAREYRGATLNTDYGVLIKGMKATVDAKTGI